MSVRMRLALIAAGLVVAVYLLTSWLILDRLADGVETDLREAADTGFMVIGSTGVGEGEFDVEELIELAPPGRSVARVGWPVVLATAPVIAAVAGLLAWAAAGRALAPVSAIRREFARLASGDLARRVPRPGGADAVARLAETMNSTLEILEQAHLRQQRFVADAAHELRGPIGAVRTRLEVAARYPDRVDAERAVTEALEDLDRLQELAEDLLALAHLESAQPISTGPADLAAALDEATSAVDDRVSVDVVPAGVLVPCGHLRLVRVLGNLIDNAARHATATVSVLVRSGADGVHVIVDDDGPGLSEADRDRAFTPFFRSDDARTRDDGGTGLGLAIVAETVHRVGGRVSVGRAPLGGARFEVTLPRLRAVEVARETQR